MRFQAGDYLVDVVVDIDQFELPITKFLPGITADTIEFARTLLEPNHMDATRNRLLLAPVRGVSPAESNVRVRALCRDSGL